MNGLQHRNSKVGFIKNIIGYRNNIIVYTCILFIFVLFLFQLPLAGQLGYEYSLVTAFFLSFILPLYLIRFYNKEKSISEKKSEIIKGIAFLVSMPLVLGIFKSLIVFPCSLKDGFFFYLLFVLPNTAVSVSISLIVIWAVKRYRIALSLVILLLIALLPVIEVYFYPQVFFYNPLIGFYPGTIYDEGIPIDFILISYRLIILFFFSFAALIPYYKIKSGDAKNAIKISYLAILLIISAAFYYYSPVLGYSSNKARIIKELGDKIETRHFNIYLPMGVDTKEKKKIEIEHEYYFDYLTRIYKSSPSQKITSYIFRDDTQKRELMGAGRADVAKPWLYEVYTELGSRDQTLKHEISHIFTASFGVTIFKVAHNFNPAMIEGIAVASEGTFDALHLRDVVQNAYNSGLKVNLNRLFDGGFTFFTNASNLSYAYAGAFVDDLVKKYGIEKFKELYSTGDFKKVYGKAFHELEKEYYTEFEKFLIDTNIHQAYYYFGGRSIFSKVCPRYVASQSEKGWDYYNNKQYNEALKTFTRLEELTSNYSSLVGIVSCMLKMNSWKEAEKLLDKKIASFYKSGYYYHLQLRLGDFASLNNDMKKSDSLYNEIISEKPQIKLVKTASLRKLLLKEGRLNEYLTGNEYQRYLVLKKIIKNGDVDAALPAFLDLSETLNISYQAEKEFLLSIPYIKKAAEDFITQMSYYSVLQLARYFYHNLDFKEAYNFSRKFSENSDSINYTLPKLELEKKLCWINDEFQQFLSGKIPVE